MLEDHDLKLMKETHSEITEKRKKSVTLLGKKKVGEDEFTGEPIYETVERPVKAIFKNQSGEELQYVNGVKIEGGDALLTLDITEDVSNVEEVEVVNPITGKAEKWQIMAQDALGVGQPNRIECLVRKIA